MFILKDFAHFFVAHKLIKSFFIELFPNNYSLCVQLVNLPPFHWIGEMSEIP